MCRWEGLNCSGSKPTLKLFYITEPSLSAPSGSDYVEHCEYINPSALTPPHQCFKRRQCALIARTIRILKRATNDEKFRTVRSENWKIVKMSVPRNGSCKVLIKLKSLTILFLFFLSFPFFFFFFFFFPQPHTAPCIVTQAAIAFPV